MRPIYFSSPAEFRAWLEKHHADEQELWVGFHRKEAGVPTLTWPQSVDEALCFGWIDGVRKKVDERRYVIRFTPRRRSSNWSNVNVRRVEELTREGRMQPPGLRAFEERQAAKSGVYSFENRAAAQLSKADETKFRKNGKAWSFFQSQPPGYRMTATWWVVSAKREETRAKRLETLIADSAAGLRIAPLRRESQKAEGRAKSQRAEGRRQK